MVVDIDNFLFALLVPYIPLVGVVYTTEVVLCHLVIIWLETTGGIRTGTYRYL